MYYLGLDYGGSQIKAALYNEHGIELAVFTQPTAAQTPAPNIVEIDMQALWKNACICIQKLLKEASKLDIYSKMLRGIAVSSHGKGLYLLDKHGKPCGPGILSSDTRATSLVQSWEQQGIKRAIAPFTRQEVWPSHPLAILGFLAEKEAQRLEESRYACMGHDYLRYCLTGQIAAERSNISGSALVDIEKNTYSAEVLEICNLQGLEEKLAPIIDSSELSGQVSHKAALDSGLTKGTPVYGGFFDVVGAAVASGLDRESDYHAIMGTWSISTCLASQLPDPSSLDNPSIPPIPWGIYALPGTYFAHDGSPSSAGNLNWFLKNFAPAQKVQGHPDFSYNDQILAQVAPQTNDLFFFPYLYASNIRAGMPGNLVGLRASHSYTDVLYAIYEGILCAHKIHLEKLRTVQAVPERLIITGGPSQSEPWMQMFADFTGLPILVLDGTKESGCKGAAMAAAVGSGQFSNFHAVMDAWVSYRAPLEPRRKYKLAWQAKYERYLRLGRGLAEVLD